MIREARSRIRSVASGLEAYAIQQLGRVEISEIGELDFLKKALKLKWLVVRVKRP